MASVFASSAVDRGFKPKIIKLVFVACPQSPQHYGERTKRGWLEIKIM